MLTGAVRPQAAATSLRASSSASLSTLKQPMPASLAAGLAHAGKDDFSRLRASGQCARQLAAGNDVKPAAGLCQQAENGLRGIGLDGVAHQRVAPGQPALPGRQRAFNGRLRVNEKRRAVLLGQLIQAKVFNHQRAVFTAVTNRRAGQGK